jgi:hypothetical protein
MQFQHLFPLNAQPTEELQNIASLPMGEGRTLLASAATNGAYVVLWTERNSAIETTVRIDAPVGYGVYAPSLCRVGADLYVYAITHKLNTDKPRPNVPVKYVWPAVFPPDVQPPAVPPVPPVPPTTSTPLTLETFTTALNTPATPLRNALLALVMDGVRRVVGSAAKDTHV